MWREKYQFPAISRTLARLFCFFSMSTTDTTGCMFIDLIAFIMFASAFPSTTFAMFPKSN